MFVRSDGHGGTITYYYSYDALSWLVGGLAVGWLAWLLISSLRQARGSARRSQTNYKLLKRAVEIKNDLSSHYLRSGFSENIHAVGLGRASDSLGYCIQIFVNDIKGEMWVGSGPVRLLDRYRGLQLVLIEMPMAGFLSASASSPEVSQYPNGIRETQGVIVGGISGANANLAGQSGTIGYFCTRRSRLPRRKEIHLLSNSHVFADLRKAEIEDCDMIMQPSPGEPATSRPIASLVNFSPVKFDTGIGDPNHIDAAIARLWGPEQHKPVIPSIGTVTGHVPRRDINLGESVRKFGRTTGYSEGRIFSICLDIWIRYDRTGQSAFFQDQFLVEPALPKFSKFVAKGDSGSLLVDANHHAVGLIFAGMAELPETLKATGVDSVQAKAKTGSEAIKRIESYGVANPICVVLDRLKIDLVV